MIMNATHLSQTYKQLMTSQLNELVRVLDSLRPEAIALLSDELEKRQEMGAVERIKAHLAKMQNGLQLTSW